ncbi:hypothetical protein Leryth_019873 [Lithospermum erythrorhizon]|nr:hypothetical protein Leryth_019873 [Lithospermum erythrorhizon]
MVSSSSTTPTPTTTTTTAVVVTYKECLKNHAASMGGHAVDGCGEFMPSPNVNPSDPTSLKCAACGCHRNFHRRDPDDPFPPPNTTPSLEYQPHRRHHPPPPPPPLPPQTTNTGSHSSPSSPSPPPISSSYYHHPSAPPPHMLLSLNTTPVSAGSNPNSRKRFRTKFTQTQKEKMLEFAERIEWKIQKRDEELISGFCNEIGVEKGVLKVWMHNNKNTLGKKDQIFINTPNNFNTGEGNGIGGGTAATAEESSAGSYNHHHQLHHNSDNNGGGHVVATTTNGSASS